MSRSFSAFAVDSLFGPANRPRVSMPMMQSYIAEACVAKQGFGFIARIIFGPSRVDLIENNKAALGGRETHVDVGEIV